MRRSTGRTYATILIDTSNHRPVDILTDVKLQKRIMSGQRHRTDQAAPPW
ncbi:hypothetical protein [Streptomyces sp. NPDC023838]